VLDRAWVPWSRAQGGVRRVLISQLAAPPPTPPSTRENSVARAMSTGAAAGAPPPAPERTSFGGLKDEDRIFQNIYGRHDISIKVRVCVWFCG